MWADGILQTVPVYNIIGDVKSPWLRHCQVTPGWKFTSNCNLFTFSTRFKKLSSPTYNTLPLFWQKTTDDIQAWSHTVSDTEADDTCHLDDSVGRRSLWVYQWWWKNAGLCYVIVLSRVDCCCFYPLFSEFGGPPNNSVNIPGKSSILYYHWSIEIKNITS